MTLIIDEKDSDVIMRVNLKGDKIFFVISIVEHESEFNCRASFRMLQYITLVLGDFEKEINGNRQDQNARWHKTEKDPWDGVRAFDTRTIYWGWDMSDI